MKTAKEEEIIVGWKCGSSTYPDALVGSRCSAPSGWIFGKLCLGSTRSSNLSNQRCAIVRPMLLIKMFNDVC